MHKQGVENAARKSMLGPCMRCAALVLCLLAGASLRAHAQSRDIDSLKTLLAAADSDTARARISNRIGSAFFYSNMDSALVWWKKGLAMGEMLAQSDDSLIREKGQRTILSSANNIAVVAQYRGLYPLALRNYQRCIRIALAIHEQRGLLNSVNNIGIIKKEQGKFEEALAHFQAAHRLALQLADSNLIGTTLNNLGTVYMKLQQDSLALSLFRQSLAFSVASGDEVQEVDNLINIGSLLVELGLPDSAQAVLMKADSIALRIEYGIARPEILLGLGKASQDQGQLPKALSIVQEALRLATELELTEVLVEALETQAQLLEANGLLHESNQSLKRFISLKDSLINAEKLLEFGQLEASFAYEREEYESALAEERRVTEVKAKQFRQYITAFAGLCGFVLLMLVTMRFVRGRWIRKMFVFAALLFFFEFLLVLVDSLIDGLTGGLPMPKLIANIALAAMIAPMHTLLERWLLKREER